MGGSGIMMRQPPKTSYKAFLMDYDWLLSLSDDECCFSLSVREVQILLSQLDVVGWKTRYQPTDTAIDQSVINAWAGNLARKLMSGCCPDDGTIGRFGESGVWEESDDGGITWHPVPENDPRNNYVGAPPLPGSPSSAKKCAGADNVKQRLLEQRDYIVGELEDWQFVPAILGGLLAFLAAIAGVSGVAIGVSVLMMGMATALLTMTPESVEEQIDEEALEKFKCLVFCVMDDNGQLTYQAWQDLLLDIHINFNDFPETFFYNTVNAWGYIGMNNAASIGDATASDCGECDCVPVCEDPNQFTGGDIISQTQNPDGSTTFVVEATVKPDTTYHVEWGLPGNTECCCIIEMEIIENECTGPASYWALCGSATVNNGTTFPSDNLGYFAFQQNGCLNSPYTMSITFANCDE